MLLHKLVATGNDFLLSDERASLASIPPSRRPEVTRRWCTRHEGLGADGMIFLENRDGYDFAWDFYNSDGSAAEMCGNAARAVSLYFSKLTGRRNLKFLTRVGDVTAEVLSEDEVQVELPELSQCQWDQSAESGAVRFDFVNSGVPHAVVRATDLENESALRQIAHELKTQARFQSTGTNVTFVRPISERQIESCTFERGVEDFTLSCGTGAVAAAAAFLRGREATEIEVQVPGGTLFVIWKNHKPRLRGKARVIAEIQTKD